MTRLLSLLCASCLILLAATVAQNSTPKKQPLRLLFLGEPDTDRAKDFETFLSQRFAAVRLADRWNWKRSQLGGVDVDVDVVVLDWPQADGISAWMLKGDKTVKPRLPLGKREQWKTPTLLLGSAGLNLAWAWDVKGAFG